MEEEAKAEADVNVPVQGDEDKESETEESAFGIEDIIEGSCLGWIDISSEIDKLVLSELGGS